MFLSLNTPRIILFAEYYSNFCNQDIIIKDQLPDTQNTAVVSDELNVMSLGTIGVATLNDQISTAGVISHDMEFLGKHQESLDQFLTRTIRMPDLNQASFDLNSFLTTNYIDAWLSNPIIAEKRNYFRYLKCNFKLTFTPIAPAFAYGVIAISYVYPWEKTSDMADPATWISTRNVVYIDISQSQSAELFIPFYSPASHYENNDISDDLTNLFPSVITLGITSVLNALDATPANYKIVVQMQATDVQLAVPTIFQAQSLTEQKQTANGPISSISSAFSNAFGALTKVPVIGPFAKTGRKISDSVTAVARIFGFSRPFDEDQHTTVGYTRFSTAEGNDQFRRLSLDPTSMTDISMFSDNNDSDSLSYRNIIGRDSIFAVYTLSTDFEVGIPVTPALLSSSAGNTGAGTLRTNFTLLTYTSLLYKYWRGSIHYTFHIVASKYHRGKVRFSWTPQAVLTNDETILATSQSLLVDVLGSTTVNFTVKWGYNVPYLTTELTTIGPSPNANGCIQISLIDAFAAPGTEPAPVEMICKFRAGDDFEFVLPEGNNIQRYSEVPVHEVTYYDYNANGVIPSLSAPLGSLNLTTNESYSNALLLPSYYIAHSASTDAAQSNVVNFVVNEQNSNDFVNKKYIGEKYNTFRTLLKRHFVGAVFKLPSTDTRYTLAIPSYPLSGYAKDGWQFPTINTPIRHFARLFAGRRGAMRINVVPEHSTTTDVVYLSKGLAQPFALALSGLSNPTGIDLLRSYQRFAAMSGMGYEPYNVKVGQQLSVEIPWQFPFNNLPADNPQKDDQYYPSILITKVQSTTEKFSGFITYAIGEDFNFSNFLGVPLLYSRGQFNSSPG